MHIATGATVCVKVLTENGQEFKYDSHPVEFVNATTQTTSKTLKPVKLLTPVKLLQKRSCNTNTPKKT